MSRSLAYRGGHPVPEGLSDDDLVERARNLDEEAVRVLIKRYNRLLFRTARAIVTSDSEAEDVVQAAYVSAFLSLQGFRGASSFSTWITRIVLNEAYGRLRKANRALPALEISWREKDGNLIMFPMMAMAAADPEQDTARAQVRQLLERAVDELPEPFRVVFVLRDVQELSIEETANLLGIKPQTVKTRLFRARNLLRTWLEKNLSPAFADIFPFDGERCAGMAESVMRCLEVKLSEGCSSI